MTMESMSVNWQALDALVVDFAKSKNLIEVSTPPPLPSFSSSSHSRVLIRQIRRSLEFGEIHVALDLLRVHAPFALEDHRLLFRLQKQKFIELLRKGTQEDRDAAIDCLRTAYPEAYEEFKHALLAFIYDKDDQSSPVAYEWSGRRRFDIAGLVFSVLRAHRNAYDPVFSMTLRYLISIHKGFCIRQGVFSPMSDLTNRLLFEERDLAAIPLESLYEGSSFDENELCRMRLNVSVLDELVHEYCVYRGIVDSSAASLLGAQCISRSEDDNYSSGLRSCPSHNNVAESGCGGNKVPDGEPSSNNTNANGFHRGQLHFMTTKDIHERYPSDTPSSHEDYSTSGMHMPVSLKGHHRNRNYGIGARNKCKRMRGRDEKIKNLT